MINYNEKFSSICQDNKLVAASNVIVKDDKIINVCNYGYKSLDAKEKATENTIFRIASISKTIASIGLMQLVEEKKINLDDDISDYFGFKVRNPKYPLDKITVKMITMQTSSITDGYDDEGDLPQNTSVTVGYNGVNGTRIDASLKDLLTPSSEYYTPLTFSEFRPGERFIYSNFGCGIMACLIEIASKEYFTDYMIKHVFEPLNIDASFRAFDIKNKELIADMYIPSKDKSGMSISRDAKSFYERPYKLYPLGENYRGPAGGLFISMKDLSTLMRMFLNKGIVNNVRLLKEETVEYMYQQHWFGNGDNGDYRAKGIQMKVLPTFDSKPFRGHTGGAYGVRSYMYFDMKNQIGSCFITNGGYYEKKTYSNMIDIFHMTLSNMIDCFYPNDDGNTFTFEIGKRTGLLKERKIVFDVLPFFENDEIYLPAISLGDALETVALHDEDLNTVTFVKNKKEITLQDLKKVDNVLVAPLKEVLNALGIKYEIANNNVKVTY